MKHLFKLTSLLLIALIVVQTSCKKDKSGNNDNPTPTNTDNKPLTIYSYSHSVSDQILATLNYKDKNVDFNFYGDKDTNGELSKIKSVTLNRTGSNDTVYNFTLDDEMKVKSFFVTYKGVNDTTILKYNYQDSLTIISGYGISSNKTVTLREQIVLRNSDYSVTSHRNYKLSPNNQMQLRLAKDAVIATIGGLLLTVKTSVVILGTTVAPPVLAVVGIGLIIYSLNDVKDMDISLIGGLKILLDTFISDSNASEDNIQPTNGVFNPSITINAINMANNLNDDWNWCSCVVNYEFPVWPSSYGGTFDNNANVRKQKQVMGSIGPSPCGGSSGSPVIASHFFQLRPNSSVNFNYWLSPYCPGDNPFSKTYHFTCK